MNYSFEYIDIILLAMIAGFIFLRLRGILGKRTGFEGKAPTQFKEVLKKVKTNEEIKPNSEFNESAQKEFLKGAKIAYETIITSFSSGDLKNIKSLLDKKVLSDFNEAIKERKNSGFISETTFIGINSADIKKFNQSNNMFVVTVDFVSEIISCIKDKDNKIISGDPEKVKKVHDIWIFSKDTRSTNPNWFLIDTQA